MSFNRGISWFTIFIMVLVAPDIEEACFAAAEEALSCGEVPVGCMMVYEDQDASGEKITFKAIGRNRVNESKNSTRHAEMECIDQLVEYFKDQGKSMHCYEAWSLVSVYVTVEPCVMCIRALCILGINNLFFGCLNDRFGGIASVYSINKDIADKGGKIINCFPASLDSNRAVSLLQRFYEAGNPNTTHFNHKKRKTLGDTNSTKTKD